MASGFIDVTDKKSFAPRWTGFDEIIKIVIRELSFNNNEKSGGLIRHLESHIPPENFDEELEMGWGFVDHRINGTTSRVLELNKMSDSDTELFWKSVNNGFQKLTQQGSEYSTLNPDLMKELLELKE